jgi:hypothetical protein
MNKRIKKIWLALLESGLYPKTTGSLVVLSEANGQSFCCLGVLCDLIAPQTFEKESWTLSYDSHNTMPSPKVMEAAGITDHQCERLADINDRSDTFKPVIAYIKRYL